jgi:hypothetical protein
VRKTPILHDTQEKQSDLRLLMIYDFSMQLAYKKAGQQIKVRAAQMQTTTVLSKYI